MTKRQPKEDSQTTKEGITINPTEASGVDPAESPEEDAEKEPEEEESGST